MVTFTHLLGKDEEMQLHKLLPSVVTFNSCIMALAFGGRWMEALHLFGKTKVGIQLPTLVLRYHALLLATESLDVLQNQSEWFRDAFGPIFYCSIFIKQNSAGCAILAGEGVVSNL